MEQINYPLLTTMLGRKNANKLVNFLSECCQPRISVTFNATCAGLNPSGVQQYNITASITYNISISGYTAVSYYAYDQPITNTTAPKNSGTFIVNGITSGVPVVVGSGVVSNPNAGIYYLVVTDNRGNFSNPLTITFPNCP